MRICFERTGGFAGRKLRKELNTDSLSAVEARRLMQLFKKSHFFELPLKLEDSSPGADRFTYKVTIEIEGRTHTVEAADGAVPAELRHLLDRLAQLTGS